MNDLPLTTQEPGMPQDDEWLIKGLMQGDGEAARVFYERFGPALQKLADKNIGPGLRRRVGPESIWQSVCQSFLRRAQAGEFQLTDSESLWRLLCAITLTKVREKARYHRRKKRSIDLERPLNHAAGSDDPATQELPDERGESPLDTMAFQEEFESLLTGFSDEEKQLVELKLQDLTNDEAAARMGSSERTVRRILSRIKERLQGAFSES
jgi:RNA polymerase sigma factor (sigma-70 family)